MARLISGADEKFLDGESGGELPTRETTRRARRDSPASTRWPTLLGARVIDSEELSGTGDGDANNAATA
jgi:hypothetical protein